MTTLEYMKRQAEKVKRHYDIEKRRPGVTQKELNDLKSKVRYYESAVAALEKFGEEQ